MEKKEKKVLKIYILKRKNKNIPAAKILGYEDIMDLIFLEKAGTVYTYNFEFAEYYNYANEGLNYEIQPIYINRFGVEIDINLLMRGEYQDFSYDAVHDWGNVYWHIKTGDLDVQYPLLRTFSCV